MFETKDETFNGWTNKPTWLVKLWLDNEQVTYNDVLDIIKNNINMENYQLGDLISGYVDENLLPENKAGLSNDLLGWSMACINWEEVAESYKDDLQS